MARSVAGHVGSAITGLFVTVLLLIVEIVLTMVLYTYLNLFHIDAFGYLVRVSRAVLDLIAAQITYWLPGSANQAYATLIGELGPKSILLLLMGLVVAAIVRSVAHILGGRHRD